MSTFGTSKGGYVEETGILAWFTFSSNTALSIKYTALNQQLKNRSQQGEALVKKENRGFVCLSPSQVNAGRKSRKQNDPRPI